MTLPVVGILLFNIEKREDNKPQDFIKISPLYTDLPELEVGKYVVFQSGLCLYPG